MTSIPLDETGDGFPQAYDHPGRGHLPFQRKRGAIADALSRGLLGDSARMNAESQITETLVRAAHGDSAAIDALIPKIYATLRRLARRQRAHEAAHTLETTALVHEAYLKLATHSGVAFTDRAHLYAYMSQVMRHILIDHARRKKAQKRQSPEMTAEQAESDIIDVLAIDEALRRLAALDPRLAQVAELRLFADLSSPDIAEVLGVNARTVERDWLKARTFLSGCLM
jgi:RNA polymerase sigma factor (TIGR02999 family)